MLNGKYMLLKCDLAEQAPAAGVGACTMIVFFLFSLY